MVAGKMRINSEKIKIIGAGAIACGNFFALGLGMGGDRIIPNVSDVQSPYVPSSIIERVISEDRGGNSIDETYIRINGQLYHVVYDEDRQPNLVPYETLSSKVDSAEDEMQ